MMISNNRGYGFIFDHEIIPHNLGHVLKNIFLNSYLFFLQDKTKRQHHTPHQDQSNECIVQASTEYYHSLQQSVV